MKRLLFLVLGFATAAAIYFFVIKKDKPKKEEPVPVFVSKYSKEFNTSISDVLNSYYAMTDGFVNWDTAKVQTNAKDLASKITAIKLDELQKDSTIFLSAQMPVQSSESNVKTIIDATDWEKKRRGLKDLSENLRMFLEVVKYDDGVVYWQECPMAFEDSAGNLEVANWLSNVEKVTNPYLGNQHPKYGKTMLNCGESKMSLDFRPKEEKKEEEAK